MSETRGLYLMVPDPQPQEPRAPTDDLTPILTEAVIRELVTQHAALKEDVRRLTDVCYALQSRLNTLERREKWRRAALLALAGEG